MEWNRSETIALAKHSCTLCHGIGLRSSWGSRVVPCNCVLRAVFRACYTQFRHCADKQECLTQQSFEYLPGSGETAVTYHRKHEEYAADFELVARRHLNQDDYKVFRYHFVHGANWKLCCARLSMDRGNFFHAIYRIQQKLGKAFSETLPYPLFPVYEYYEEIKQPVSSLDTSGEETADERASRKTTVPRISPQRTAQPYPGEVLPSRRKIA